MYMIAVSVILAFWVALAESQAASVSAPQLPIAVKSPYLNSWISFSGDGTSPAGAWAGFWNKAHITAWAGLVRVDGQAYQWIGQGFRGSNTTASYITPTRSIFSYQVGPVRFNTTFLSPIEPSDLTRQSLPFVYLYIDVTSADGKPHSVQFYTDVTGEWISADIGANIEWTTSETSSTLYHRLTLSTPSSMQESGDIAEDGTLYYAIQKRSDMTWQTDDCGVMRGAFETTTSLLNATKDTNFRPIEKNWPGLAMAVDLGSITQTSEPIVWALGLIRDPVVRYIKGNNIETRIPYFRAKYSNDTGVIDAVLANSKDALSRAIALDNQIMSAGESISTKYADLLAVSLRQTMGSLEITLGRTTDGGQANMSDVRVFMKDVGSGRRVNPVETIYAALPALLYLNSSLVRPLLEPLLEYQSSSIYRNSYAAADLGGSFPDALGNNTDTPLLGVENCGSMLIMTFAHAQKSGDGSLITRYYHLLKQWADFLVTNSLHPNGYTTADGLNNPDMSNLAIKGIAGIYAMGKIDEALGKSSTYLTKAQEYITSWEGLAFSSDHITSSYGQSSSWALTYNLYGAKLIGMEISDKVSSSQSDFYVKQAASAPTFGLQYDSNVKNVKSHWSMFTAGTTTNNAARDLFISMVHDRAFFAKAAGPFPTTYDMTSGADNGGAASPAQGAMFSLLALGLPNQRIVVPASSTKKSNAAAIAGGVVGGVCLILITALCFFLWRKRQKQRSRWDYGGSSTVAHVRPAHQTMMPVLEDTGPPVTTPLLHPSINPFSLPELNPTAAQPLYSNTKGASNSGRMVLSPQGQYILNAPSSEFSSTTDNNSLPHAGSAYELRNEVEELRREMAQMRSQRLVDEPPPLYQDDFPASSSVNLARPPMTSTSASASSSLPPPEKSSRVVFN
ncbi:hypothetical protein BDQ12DRAFT_683319 [Crucibulum laeve]|uniref:DUF1793-domain-containing protein n=1 Tax=Crucibulum laeve TaxID=68775 RepID=A0A5C3M1X2_9AGAR|nr:hypothetical protein BDQ12DRAFT_683319 [Crucibulum laeve]